MMSFVLLSNTQRNRIAMLTHLVCDDPTSMPLQSSLNFDEED